LEQGMNFCPDASKIGTVTIHSPLLPNPIVGAVYLATQNQNPFGSLIALYLIAKDPVSGFVFKSAGETRLTPSGQLIGTFKNNPQLPFEDAELHFFGGERAPLATPAHCGSYITNAAFSPWSGNEAVSASSTFNITSGPHDTPCPGASLPFAPSLMGGMTNINAGAFSPLTTTIGRADGQQDMQSVQLHMPAGLEGLLSGLTLCPETQANEGTCGPGSLIGETTVSAGVGSDPVSVTGGKVYITEKYAGATFGLSIVNPVKAGPFDLEHDTSNPNNHPACDCVVVRAKVDVDRTTAALTITTDPTGPHAIPHLIDGIPVQIKHVNVLVPDDGAAGLRRDGRSCGYDVHQQSRCYEHDVQDRSRRPLQHVRTHAAHGEVFRADRAGERLQRETDDAQRIRRAERHDAAPEHERRRHRLREEEGPHPCTEAHRRTEGLPQEAQSRQARRLRTHRPQEVRPRQAQEEIARLSYGPVKKAEKAKKT
jgi:hypothetical protein